MKAKVIKLVLLLAAAVAIWWLGRPQAPAGGAPKQEGQAMSEAAVKARQEAAALRAQNKEEPLPGAEILAHYGDAATRPEDDLHAMAHAFSNLMLLAKGNAPFRMGANEEFAAALLGKNAAGTVFLVPPHACLNASGQIVDRWGTPLFFHVRDAARIDIRSAGPDHMLWTADDLHRQHDGQFARGAALPETGQ